MKLKSSLALYDAWMSLPPAHRAMWVWLSPTVIVFVPVKDKVQ